MNNDDHWKLIRAAGTLALGFLVHLSYKRYKKNKQNLEQFMDPEKNIYHQDIREGKTSYIRVKLKRSPIRHYQQTKISYNQYYIMEPSDWLVINKAQPVIQQQLKQRIIAMQEASGKEIEVKGIKKLLGDVYQTDWKYRSIECGPLKRLYGGICWVFQKFIFQPVRISQFEEGRVQVVNPNRKPTIQGPIVGVLAYSVSLITDGFFVLKCKLENGVLYGQILAQSKGLLIELMNGQITKDLLRTVGIGIIFAIGLRMLLKDIKKFFINRKLNNLIPLRKKVLDIPNLSIDKCCIICYSNSRNILFFDCKHFIICESCYEEQEMTQCPICKSVITNSKPIYQYKPDVQQKQ